MKIVISACYGGFSLSTAALEVMANLGHEGAKKEFEETKERAKLHPERFNGTRGSHLRDVERNHPLLIEAVEKLGVWASGECAKLVIVEVDNNSGWYVNEYDGYESIKFGGERGVPLVQS